MKPTDRCPFVWRNKSKGEIICPLCAHDDTLPVGRNLAKIIRECPVRKVTNELGWGDRVHRVLSTIGITPKRIARVFREEKERCGCAKRQQALNAAGWTVRWYFTRVRAALQYVLCPSCRRMMKTFAAMPARAQARRRETRRVGRLQPVKKVL